MRVGLISICGVRIHDQELHRLGLTLPGFVERGKVIASLPSLGLLTLAGMTDDVEYEYHDLPDWKSVAHIPDNFDLVAISALSASIKEAYALAAEYRRRGIKTVLGGLHVTVCPDEAKRHCDSVVIGEGENSWPQLIRDFQRGTLKDSYGVAYADFDLNHAPMPAYELLDMSRYNRLTVQTQRGCPHRCEFCATSTLLTRKYKRKPIDKVVNEIHKIRDLWNSPFIEFADDNSFIAGEYGRELIHRLRHENLKWFTETDISIARNDALLGLLADAGCRQILVGLESPDEAGMAGLETRSNWKLKRVKEYKAAIRKIQSYGITVNGCFILGLDEQTPSVFDTLYDFIADSDLYEVQLTVLTPFPGTMLYDRLKREGRLLEPTAWERCTLFDINYQPKNMEIAELRAGLVHLMERVYDREFVSRRRSRFFRNYKGSLVEKKAREKALQDIDQRADAAAATAP